MQSITKVSEMFLAHLCSILKVLSFPDLWCFSSDTGIIGVHVIVCQVHTAVVSWPGGDFNHTLKVSGNNVFNNKCTFPGEFSRDWAHVSYS